MTESNLKTRVFWAGITKVQRVWCRQVLATLRTGSLDACAVRGSGDNLAKDVVSTRPGICLNEGSQPSVLDQLVQDESSITNFLLFTPADITGISDNPPDFIFHFHRSDICTGTYFLCHPPHYRGLGRWCPCTYSGWRSTRRCGTCFSWNRLDYQQKRRIGNFYKRDNSTSSQLLVTVLPPL